MALQGRHRGGIILALVLASIIPGSGASVRAQSIDSADVADVAGMAGWESGKLDGLGTSQTNEAGSYQGDAIAPRRANLGAYGIEKAERNARLLPGLAGTTKRIQGARKVHMSDAGKPGYSLAEALADALWRKRVVDALYRNPDGSLAKDIFE